MKHTESVYASKIINHLSFYGIKNTTLADLLGMSKQLFAKRVQLNSFSPAQEATLLAYLTSLATESNTLLADLTKVNEVIVDESKIEERVFSEWEVKNLAYLGLTPEMVIAQAREEEANVAKWKVEHSQMSTIDIPW